MNKFCLFVSLLATLSPAVHSISVTDIQGPGFQSPYANQVVSNITALVTAKVCISNTLKATLADVLFLVGI